MPAPTASPTVSSTVGLKNMVIAPLTEDTEETVSYGTLQAVAGAADAALDRADGAAADLGDFLIGQPARADQDQRFALVFRQLGQSAAHLVQLQAGDGVGHRDKGPLGDFRV